MARKENSEKVEKEINFKKFAVVNSDGSVNKTATLEKINSDFENWVSKNEVDNDMLLQATMKAFESITSSSDAASMKELIHSTVNVLGISSNTVSLNVLENRIRAFVRNAVDKDGNKLFIVGKGPKGGIRLSRNNDEDTDSYE